MQISPQVYSVHIDDNSLLHPGGSNIFFAGEHPQGMVIIDAGENDPMWFNKILDEYNSLGKPSITGILITHSHRDHIGGLPSILGVVKAPVFCHPKLVSTLTDMIGVDSVVGLRDNELITTGRDVVLEALFTPGHDDTHVCYYMASDKLMFTGDTVLGSSSSTVQDMYSYMQSMERLSRYKVDIVCPGHGSVLPYPDGGEVIGKYIQHRIDRENAVKRALKHRINLVDDIVDDVYGRDLIERLRGAARRNIIAHLEKLVKEDVVDKNYDGQSYNFRHS